MNLQTAFTPTETLKKKIYNIEVTLSIHYLSSLSEVCTEFCDVASSVVKSIYVKTKDIERYLLTTSGFAASARRNSHFATVAPHI